ncbi:hypothetical protein Tco_0375097 [Tanacetum coccineum]
MQNPQQNRVAERKNRTLIDGSKKKKNLLVTLAVDPVPTKRVNTIHPQSQILGDLTSPVQIRGTLRFVPLPDGVYCYWDINGFLKNKEMLEELVVRIKRLVLKVNRRGGHLTRMRSHFPKHVYGDVESVVWSSSNNTHGPVQVYVDDIIFGSTKKAWCDEFEVLMKGEFEMSAMGELTVFLGLPTKNEVYGYPKRFSFVLEAYSDSDYAGSHGDRKSTTGGCQFCCRRL